MFLKLNSAIDDLQEFRHFANCLSERQQLVQIITDFQNSLLMTLRLILYTRLELLKAAISRFMF